MIIVSRLTIVNVGIFETVRRHYDVSDYCLVDFGNEYVCQMVQSEIANEDGKIFFPNNVIKYK